MNLRNRRMTLTMEGGIIFGAFMLVIAIILIVMLLRLPKSSPAAEDTAKGTVWAQVLSTSDIQRLETPPQPLLGEGTEVSGQ